MNFFQLKKQDFSFCTNLELIWIMQNCKQKLRRLITETRMINHTQEVPPDTSVTSDEIISAFVGWKIKHVQATCQEVLKQKNLEGFP